MSYQKIEKVKFKGRVNKNKGHSWLRAPKTRNPNKKKVKKVNECSWLHDPKIRNSFGR